MTIGLLVPVTVKGWDHVVAVLDFADFTSSTGGSSNGYTQMRDDTRVTLVHSRVMGTKPRDAGSVDHVNGDRLDDRRLNLRFVTAAEYSADVKIRAASGYRGVYPNKGT
jgi:HNH endonuclease